MSIPHFCWIIGHMLDVREILCTAGKQVPFWHYGKDSLFSTGNMEQIFNIDERSSRRG